MRIINRNVLIGGGVAVTAIIAFLALAVFEVQTLFIDDKVDEANPFAVVPAQIETGSDQTDTDQTDTDQTDTGQTGEPAEVVPDTVVTLVSGDFFDASHPTSGQGVVITDGSEQRFLRFENFETDNGPDLNVYLRSSTDPDDYIDLGDLKGNIGSQNYELPADLDLSVYDTIDIWCVRFGVSFGGAVLA